MRRLITDQIRDILGPLVTRSRSRLGPGPELPGRTFFEAAPYRARTGIP